MLIVDYIKIILLADVVAFFPIQPYKSFTNVIFVIRLYDSFKYFNEWLDLSKRNMKMPNGEISLSYRENKKGMFWKSILNDMVFYNRIEPELHCMKSMTKTQKNQTGLNIESTRF